MNKLVNLFRGTVRLEIGGAGPEEYLNALSRSGVPFWDLERADANTFYLTVHKRSLAAAKRAGRRSYCDVKVLARRGAPFIARRMRRRYVFLGGMLMAALVLLWSSLYVWEIEVTGNEKVPTSEILMALKEAGVTEGSFWPSFSNDLIRSRVVMAISDVKWLAVNVRGSKATVIVRERINKPELLNEDALAQVVADKSGIVTSIDVFSGKAAVTPGKTVVEGDLLIEAQAETRFGDVYPIRAMGEVRARTWYEFTAKAPLMAEEKDYTGDKKTRFALTIGPRRINFYLNSGICGENCDKIISVYQLAIADVFSLPVWLEKVSYLEYEAVPVLADEEALEERMKEALLDQLRTRMDPEGEIVQTDFLLSGENGSLVLRLRAECVEPIGRTLELPG